MTRPSSNTQALLGCKTVITRASHQSLSLREALEDAGAEVIEAPAIAIVPPTDGGQPLDDALLRLDRFSWVAFTSANAVAATFTRADRRGARERFAHLKIATVGPAAAERVFQEIDRPPDLVPTIHNAAELAKVFPPPSLTDHCFVPMAQQGRPDFVTGLQTRGWAVTAVAAYRTVQPDLPLHLLDDVINANVVVFASPSAVNGYLAQLRKHDHQPNPATAVVCIGDTTAEACRQLGLTPATVSTNTTPNQLVAAVIRAVSETTKP